MSSKQLVTNILTGTAPQLAKRFRQLPLADKMLELEKAFVEPKKSDTPDLLNVVIKELVTQGAIYPEEVSSVYERLLSRMVKYNSLRNHQNLATFVQDVQQGQRAAIMASLQNVPAMSNMVVLQNFYNTLPKTVSSGQQNYDAFKQLLKQFVIEYNQFLEVYKSGPDTFLQYSYGPQVQKVNLTQAFNNLANIWGVKVTNEDSIPALTSLLLPQSRFLILLLSPIAMEGSFIRDSFISYLITLYKNTVAPPVRGHPVQELGNVIASLGPDYDQIKLRQGLNYIVTNQTQQYRPTVPDLTKEEEALLRYVQTLLKTKLAGTQRRLKEADLDNVLMNMNPIIFAGQLDFLTRLFDYFRKVLKARPDLLTQIIYDRNWQPPPAFFHKDVLLPEDLVPVPAPRQIVSSVSSIGQQPVSQSSDSKEVVPVSRPVQSGLATSAVPGLSKPVAVGTTLAKPTLPPPREVPALPGPSSSASSLTPSQQKLVDRLAWSLKPIPYPRSVFPRIRPKPVKGVPYRSPLPLINTDDSTDSESDLQLVQYSRAKQKKKVNLDLKNLTSQFSKMQGKGVDMSNLLLSDMRQRVRNINLRPY
ncbi:pIIIa [Great tit adenovirus 1]|uniref:PIIIa n=1 Tax=Great tit adenovirus 1 TaxID=676130 RepID=D0QX14_9ADEN|nr:pIIIa [Great tit adenovirus 1]ACW84425.1 pIIIa [Great tit adenovirus 1]